MLFQLIVFITVLVLAGRELIFLFASHMVLFVTKTVLITHNVLATAEQCLHRVKAFSASHIGSLWVVWGYTRSLEWTQMRELNQTNKRKKLEERRGRTLWVMVFIFSTVRCKEASLFHKWLNTCLLMESSEWIPCFVLLVHAALQYPLNCL